MIRFRSNLKGSLSTRLLTAALLAVSAPALAAPTPAAKCEAGKNDALGKYTACIQKAQAKFAIGGSVDTDTLGAALATCESKYTTKWSALEAKAGDGVCPSQGDQSAVQDFMDACAAGAAEALGGGQLPVNVAACNDDLDQCNADLATCGGTVDACTDNLNTTSANLGACNDDLSVCNDDLTACQSASGGGGLARTGQTNCYNSSGTLIACAGTGQDADFAKGVARSFTDNGDGTITDNATGLMWELLHDGGGIHDVDNTYTWDNAFAVKIATLNSGMFAGYDDWRLPNIVELESLKNFGTFNPATFPEFNTNCSGGCSVCSCTRSGLQFWSSTTMMGFKSGAHQVLFNAGDTTGTFKTDFRYVRAVRGGN
jgi:hypothetical protein